MDNSKILLTSITQFYETKSESSRKDLGIILENFRQGRGSWRVAVSFIDNTNPVNVQFFGAETLYFIISRRFDEILEHIENIDELKAFFLHKLSSSAHSLAHSVLNKLSAAFALFILKCLPDIWGDSISELQVFWSCQIELLLRVLAEISSEFNHLNVSLDHRQNIRTELQKSTNGIVQMVQQVMMDNDLSCSVRNAAVECIEGWMKLPGTNLLDFLSIFDVLFNNICNDYMGLTRILDTIKSNDGLRNLHRLLWQLTSALTNSVLPQILMELNLPQEETDNLLEKMEDISPLISTIVEFAQEYSKYIVDFVCKNYNEQSIVEVYLKLCTFFFHVSTFPGLYPTQECISDLPEPWWRSLREELLQLDEGFTWSSNRYHLKEGSIKWYLQMLESAILKFVYSKEINLFDKESLEKFEQYRTFERSDVSINAIQLASQETVLLLTNKLNIFLEACDVLSSEAVIHLLTEAADFLRFNHLNMLLPTIYKCITLNEWKMRNVSDTELIYFAKSYLRFIQKIEHLLINCSENERVLKTIVQTILSYIQIPELNKSSFETLLIIMKRKENVIKIIVDQIINCCYEYFANELNPSDLRILSMRCLGTGLSFKDNETIIKSLQQMLFPWLKELQNVANQLPKNDGWLERINFELSILASLVSSLRKSSNNDQIALSESPVKLILTQSLPLFNNLLSVTGHPSVEIIEKICDVLEAGILSLYTNVAPLLQNYLCFIDIIITTNPVPACELAKKLFLTFHKESDETPILIKHLASWYLSRFTSISNNLNISNFPTILDENLVEFAHHIFKKFWDPIMFASTFSEETYNFVLQFIQSACYLLDTVIELSRDASLMQESLRGLSLFLKKLSQNDNGQLIRSVEIVAEKTISVVFLSIRNESTLSANVNHIADILFFFMSKYPSQTRTIIQNLPNGDSQHVSLMFSSPSVKVFRLHVLQMHQTFLHKG
ncbi:Xpo1 domain-containing protein [Meloidogyne graminicola]|uniref:Xpo1 domain-containing protein n=1 Tax=Meloidogyne graminicola TaxID=189291 RepID=A0A8S9ZXI5_9BILA|nr:Xpo1 domain-containing protein [Meloidogyne graminicola]